MRPFDRSTQPFDGLTVPSKVEGRLSTGKLRAGEGGGEMVPDTVFFLTRSVHRVGETL